MERSRRCVTLILASRRLNIGAFFSISGMIINLTEVSNFDSENSLLNPQIIETIARPITSLGCL
jgi:lantibiotic modifying enzyme